MFERFHKKHLRSGSQIKNIVKKRTVKKMISNNLVQKGMSYSCIFCDKMIKHKSKNKSFISLYHKENE